MTRIFHSLIIKRGFFQGLKEEAGHGKTFSYQIITTDEDPCGLPSALKALLSRATIENPKNPEITTRNTDAVMGFLKCIFKKSSFEGLLYIAMIPTV